PDAADRRARRDRPGGALPGERRVGLGDGPGAGDRRRGDGQRTVTRSEQVMTRGASASAVRARRPPTPDCHPELAKDLTATACTDGEILRRRSPGLAGSG